MRFILPGLLLLSTALAAPMFTTKTYLRDVGTSRSLRTSDVPIERLNSMSQKDITKEFHKGREIENDPPGTIVETDFLPNAKRPDGVSADTNIAGKMKWHNTEIEWINGRAQVEHI